jgi:hypothetical protein
MNDQQIEKEIQEKGLTAPRVTPDDIEDNICQEHYFTGEAGPDAVRFSWLFADHADRAELDAARAIQEQASVMSLSAIRKNIDIAMGRDGIGYNFEAIGLLTYCTLVLQNGFTVTGESACASPENFDEELGRKIARQNAIAKIWPLMGYELKQRLFESGQ